MRYTHRQQREIFHFLFLERLLKIADPRLFVLKGGVNLRFFFASPRYSEDMDLDVLAGSVATLKKNGYRILEDPAFARSLAKYEVDELIVNDPSKAKQTQTTQRFRAQLVNMAGESYPTKVEFSRRGSVETFSSDPIDPSIARQYQRLAYECQHYPGAAAATQKIRALANRPERQVRDVFDLYVLWLGGHALPEALGGLPVEERERAESSLLSFEYRDYEGQVLEFLEPEARSDFEGDSRWNEICERVLNLLVGMKQ